MHIKPSTRKRTYLDPIHQDISLDWHDPAEALIIELIDTPEFQRLRRIQQLGVSCFTFQGAEGSRFTHSVGVMYIASKLVGLLAERTPQVLEHKALILASALLHDIGHGPYSHVSENIIGYDHEDWSCKIIGSNTAVHQVLVHHDKTLPDQVIAVLSKTYPLKYISDIISSQLDCDRFDYLLRDSYMTGTAYGLFALHRILASLEIDEGNDRLVVAGEKGQTAVEDYLFARYFMYAQVYYHRKNLAARTQLAKLIKRAKLLGTRLSFIDQATTKFLSGAQLDVNDFLFLDDVQMTYHIKRWASDPDSTVCDLSRRFLTRNLFATSKLPALSNEQLVELEHQASLKLATCGFDPEYYLGIEQTGLRPYDYYRPDAACLQTNIMVRTDSGTVRELSTISPTIEALVKGKFDLSWLIYPQEAKQEITALIDDFVLRNSVLLS